MGGPQRPAICQGDSAGGERRALEPSLFLTVFICGPVSPRGKSGNDCARRPVLPTCGGRLCPGRHALAGAHVASKSAAGQASLWTQPLPEAAPEPAWTAPGGGGGAGRPAHRGSCPGAPVTAVGAEAAPGRGAAWVPPRGSRRPVTRRLWRNSRRYQELQHKELRSDFRAAPWEALVIPRPVRKWGSERGARGCSGHTGRPGARVRASPKVRGCCCRASERTDR